MPARTIRPTIDVANHPAEVSDLEAHIVDGSAISPASAVMAITSAINKHNKQLSRFNVPPLLITISLCQFTLLVLSILKNKGFAPIVNNPLLGASQGTIVEMGGMLSSRLHQGEIWRFATCLFVQSGCFRFLADLVLQMILLTSLEKPMGTLRTIVIFFTSGATGTLTCITFLPAVISTGSTPSLAGLVGMNIAKLITNWEWTGDNFLSILKTVVCAMLLIFIGYLPYANHFANLGGFLAGFCLSMAIIADNSLLKAKASLPRSRAIRVIWFVGTIIIVVLHIVGAIAVSRFESNWCSACGDASCFHVPGLCYLDTAQPAA